MSLTPLFGPVKSSVSEVDEVNSTGTCQLLVIENRELTFLGHVARGGMAEISLYMWNRRGYPPKKVAKKSLFRGSIKARYEASLKKEMDLLAQLDHRNIVTTYGVVETDHDFGLVMEYLRFGSCRHFFGTLRDEADKRLPDLDQRLAPLKIKIIGEVIDGMNYLHGMQPKRVLHLDLKSDNVLLDDNLNAKICDFGLSKMATLTMLRSATTARLGGAAGTPGYIPPETLQNPTSKPTSKSDVYSFSIFVWELLADRMPYEDIDCRQINLLKIYVVDQEGRPDMDCIPNVYPQELINMMKQAWSPRPEDRQSFEDMQKELNIVRQHNPEVIHSTKDSTRQILALWESLCASSYGTERYDTVLDETSYHSTCVSEPVRRTVSTMAESTTPKRHTDTNITSKRHISGKSTLGAEAIPLSPLISQDENTDPQSPTIMFVEKEKKCSYVKIIFVIVTALVVFAGGGVVLWMVLTGRPAACSDLPKPTNGSATCTPQTETMNEICSFSCGNGYSLRGEDEVVCSAGKWSGKPPICVPTCSDLNEFSKGKYTCSNGAAVDSTCNFICDENYQLVGNSTTTCLKDRTWSTPKPKCECPPCYVGSECQNSIKWTDVITALRTLKAYSSLTVQYGGESFTCTAQLSSIFIDYTGFCSDFGIQKSCGKYEPPEAARRAASYLVKYLIERKKYPSPCDPENMDTRCND